MGGGKTAGLDGRIHRGNLPEARWSWEERETGWMRRYRELGMVDFLVANAGSRNSSSRGFAHPRLGLVA